MDEGKDGMMDGLMDGCDGWMDEWSDGSIDGWMGGHSGLRCIAVLSALGPFNSGCHLFVAQLL